MCLGAVFSKKLKKKITDEMKPREDVIVWKIVGVEKDGYRPISNATRRAFKVGLNEADTTVQIETDSETYKAGYHFFAEKKAAKRILKSSIKNIESNRYNAKKNLQLKGEVLHDVYVVIPCQIKKSWITAIGTQWGDRVIVTKKAIFPDPKESK